MKTSKQIIGAGCEQEAENYLSGLGYEILGRNICTLHGENDLVAQLGEITCFVEALPYYPPADPPIPSKRSLMANKSICWLCRRFRSNP